MEEVEDDDALLTPLTMRRTSNGRAPAFVKGPASSSLSSSSLVSATSTIVSKPKPCRVGPYFTPQPAFSPSKKTTTEVDEEDMAGVCLM